MQRPGVSRARQTAALSCCLVQTLLKDQLELVRIKQPDGPARYSIKPLECEFSFDKGFFMFIRAIQLLTQHNKDTTLVRPQAATSLPPPSGWQPFQTDFFAASAPASHWRQSLS